MITAGADSWRDQSSARSSGKSCHCLWIHPSRSWRVAGDHDDDDDGDDYDCGDDDDDDDDDGEDDDDDEDDEVYHPLHRPVLALLAE